MKLPRRPAGPLPLFLLLLASLPLVPAPALRAQVFPLRSGVADTHQADVAAALATAETWLRQLDAGEYGRSWQESAPYFQRAATEAKWNDLLGNVRLPLGKPVNRRNSLGLFSTTMPGVPEGAYVFLQFDTAFERNKLTVETVTCLRDTDGRWKVAGYFIK